MRAPLLSRLLLLSPRTAERNLATLAAAGLVEHAPNAWQVTLGVFRMWHRITFRPETIGTCAHQRTRRTWRARLLAWRALRLPCLLLEGAVTPWDLSGLLSNPGVLERHLLGAHHDGNQFVYDLEALSAYPGRLERLESSSPAVKWSPAAWSRPQRSSGSSSSWVYASASSRSICRSKAFRFSGRASSMAST